jgi:hypothetical protein
MGESMLRTTRIRAGQLVVAEVVATAVAGGSGTQRLPWLRTLAPTLVIRPVRVGAATVGVGADEDGWFAAVEVGSLWDDDPQPSGGSPWTAVVAAAPSTLGRVCRDVVSACADAGVRPRRLDGEQALAAYAAAPTAVPPAPNRRFGPR